MKTLTDAALRKMVPDPSRRIETPVLGIRGLYIIIQPTGVKSFAIRYRYGGRSRKLTLGRYPRLSLAEARKQALDALDLVDQGHDPGAARQASKEARMSKDQDRVTRVIADYIKSKRRLRSIDTVRRYLEVEVVPAIGDRRIQEIKKRDIAKILNDIVDRGSPITANRVFANLRAMFNWAWQQGLIESSPFQGMKLPVKERSRDRTLSVEEIALFWRAAEQLGQPFGPLYRLLLLTGQRLREVSEMRWSEVEGNMWTLPAVRTKNDKAHTIPLSTLARATLDEIHPIKGEAGYVFTTNGEAPVSGFTKAKRRLDKAIARIAKEKGLNVPAPFVIHDLRRTTTSGMAELGVPPHVCEAVLNHTRGEVSGVAKIYNRYAYGPEKCEALQRWAKKVASIVSDHSLEPSSRAQ